MSKKADLVKKITDDLLEKIGTKAKAKVDYDKESDCYNVSIDAGEDTGLLIGRKGDNLLSIQTLVGLIYKNKQDEWVRVSVNVGDYREKEEEYLKGLAESTALRAKETNQSQRLYNLKPAQRRFIHLHLSENSDIVTESQGEGRDRYLVVSPK